MDLSSIARWVILAGVAIIIVGIGLWFAARFDLPLGRLPGDIHIEKNGFSCFIPLATSILLSLLLTLALNILLRFLNR
ncbi:MAG: DUF2905 domain-containing protein [Anaerolineales bacterium]|nr:DUF2905 domain-containing protein [Anaerolineales bacterium]TET97603.1 MAG: DUF2905 domain-containing protein [Anaerolineales bacterium]